MKFINKKCLNKYLSLLNSVYFYLHFQNAFLKYVLKCEAEKCILLLE